MQVCIKPFRLQNYLNLHKNTNINNFLSFFLGGGGIDVNIFIKGSWSLCYLSSKLTHLNTTPVNNVINVY